MHAQIDCKRQGPQSRRQPPVYASFIHSHSTCRRGRPSRMPSPRTTMLFSLPALLACRTRQLPALHTSACTELAECVPLTSVFCLPPSVPQQPTVYSLQPSLHPATQPLRYLAIPPVLHLPPSPPTAYSSLSILLPRFIAPLSYPATLLFCFSPIPPTAYSLLSLAPPPSQPNQLQHRVHRYCYRITRIRDASVRESVARVHPEFCIRYELTDHADHPHLPTDMIAVCLKDGTSAAARIGGAIKHNRMTFVIERSYNPLSEKWPERVELRDFLYPKAARIAKQVDLVCDKNVVITFDRVQFDADDTVGRRLGNCYSWQGRHLPSWTVYAVRYRGKQSDRHHIAGRMCLDALVAE